MADKQKIKIIPKKKYQFRMKADGHKIISLQIDKMKEKGVFWNLGFRYEYVFREMVLKEIKKFIQDNVDVTVVTPDGKKMSIDNFIDSIDMSENF